MPVKKLKRISRAFAVIALIIVDCQPQSVTESSVQGRVTNLRGQPIQNVVVQFYKLLHEKEGGGEELVYEVSPDETGRYEAKGLDWGRYRIHFEGSSPFFGDEDVWGYHVYKGSTRVLDVALSAGMAAHLGAESRVKGVVTDEAGQPTAGATVVILPVFGPGQYRQTHTKDDGEFVFVVEDGSYIVYATAPGAVSEPVRFRTRGFETRGEMQNRLTLKLLPDS